MPAQSPLSRLACEINEILFMNSAREAEFPHIMPENISSIIFTFSDLRHCAGKLNTSI
ncbi:hypothetical protein BDV09DRAFT_167250 [Aspergillus tetrazonus]